MPAPAHVRAVQWNSPSHGPGRRPPDTLASRRARLYLVHSISSSSVWQKTAGSAGRGGPCCSAVAARWAFPGRCARTGQGSICCSTPAIAGMSIHGWRHVGHCRRGCSPARTLSMGCARRRPSWMQRRRPGWSGLCAEPLRPWHPGQTKASPSSCKWHTEQTSCSSVSIGALSVASRSGAAVSCCGISLRPLSSASIVKARAPSRANDGLPQASVCVPPSPSSTSISTCLDCCSPALTRQPQ